MDNPVTVHDINELTVVTDESYTDFVDGLQKEISESLASSAPEGDGEVLHRMHCQSPTATSVIERELGKSIYIYLVKNDYVDDDDTSDRDLQEAASAGRGRAASES